VEEFVQAMEKLTTDMRFTLFNICYKRILVIWIVTAFVILLSLLFSGFQVQSRLIVRLIIKRLSNPGSISSSLNKQLFASRIMLILQG
jgi:hypothetical protein